MIVNNMSAQFLKENLMRVKNIQILFYLEKFPTSSSNLNLMNVDKTQLSST